MNLEQILQRLVDLVQSIDPFYAVIIYLDIAFGISMLRSLVLGIARLSGLYHINQFSRWPNIIPWRVVVRGWMKISEWWQEVFVFGKGASGGFLHPLFTCTLMYRPSYFPIGRLMIFGIGWLMPVGINIKRHIVLLGQTGSGKSAYLTLVLSCWSSSAFYIDPKGEITRILKGLLKKTLHIIAPYDSNLNNVIWNVFDEMKAAEKRVGNKDVAVRVAVKIAEALIKKEEGEKNPIFTVHARNLWKAIILHVYTAHKPQDHDLITCYDLLCRGYWWIKPDKSKGGGKDDPIITLLRIMEKNPAYNGFIAKQASTILRENPATRGNVLTTAQGQLEWLGYPDMLPILKGKSTFLCEELKYKDDVYLSFVAPATSIKLELSGFSRLLTNLITYTFESIPGNKKIPCLFAIDEFQSQGYNEYIETSAPLMRGYGILAVYVVQDRGGLDAVYNKTADGFSGNADAIIYMPGNHEGTIETVSRRLGKCRIKTKDKNNEKIFEESHVMDPEQVKRFLNFERGNIIVDLSGSRPLKLKRLNYYNDLPVKSFNSSNEHKVPLLKKLTRMVIKGLSKIRI